jgi:mediator of RNA polymerase II transcription subunit 7
MADQPDPQQYLRSQLASTWPDPPPFWKDFTTENIEAFQKLKTAAGEGGEQGKTEDGTVRRIPNVPEQLINLQPPAEPADGKWRVFGDLYSV